MLNINANVVLHFHAYYVTHYVILSGAQKMAMTEGTLLSIQEKSFYYHFYFIILKG